MLHKSYLLLVFIIISLISATGRENDMYPRGSHKSREGEEAENYSVSV